MTLNDPNSSYYDPLSGRYFLSAIDGPWAEMEILKDEIFTLRNERKLLEPYITRMEEIDTALTKKMDKYRILYGLFKNEP